MPFTIPSWVNYQTGTLTVAVGGIILTAWLSGRRDKKNRIMQMKREVYLGFIEDAASHIRYVAKLGNSLETIQDTGTSNTGAIGKVQMVGSMEVIKAAFKMHSEIAKLTLNLVEEKLKVQIMNIDLKNKNERLMDCYKKATDFAEKINRGETTSRSYRPKNI